jgi:hypothetical protein
MQSKDEFLCVIHDKMDHAKIALPKFQVTNKMIYGLRQLPITLIGMITHGHGDERHVLDFNELWLSDPNFTVMSLLRLFQTLEKAPVSKSKILLEQPP